MAASGLAVGLALTVARNAMGPSRPDAAEPPAAGAQAGEGRGATPSLPGLLPKPAGEPAGGKESAPDKGLKRRGGPDKGPGTPPPVPRRERRRTLPAAIAAGPPSGPRKTRGLPPLDCFDAASIEKSRACRDSRLRESTTLDWDLQLELAEFMRRRPLVAAALVIVDVKTGELRVMLSHEPSLKQPSQEALTARAPAASVYKIVTAAALLDRGVRASQRVCFHTASRAVEEHHVRDNPRRDRICENLLTAFAKSRNAVFAKLAYKHLNKRSLERVGRSLGFDAVLPFAYPVQASRAEVPRGRLPRARAAAGFSAVSLSPLHGALIAATIARGGTFPLPVIEQGARAEEATRVLGRRDSIHIGRMMRAAVKNGTARKTLAGAVVSAAAKTGSLSAYRDGRRRHHSWMVGYAPAARPKIAFAALVVNDELWHIRSGHLTKAALDAWAKR